MSETQETSTGLRILVADPKHGPLPALLLVLTIVTGAVDAVSILSLGRVFVANMTGNVVFVGFALAGAPGFSLSASLFALGGFLVGAAVGGALIGRIKSQRAALLRACVTGELLLLTAALLIAIIAGTPFTGVAVDSLAALAAVAMGLQNAVVRKLAVPDLTTTVLTMTITGLAADLRGGGHGPAVLRRLLAVAMMLIGAVAGALLVLHVGAAAGLGLAVGLLVIACAGSVLAARQPAGWN
ncbi:uncharacterized membrane protein YoaK (UPF0700 family) [Jatrophihabitans sp. GAS493]|uniref:YoaK family protein n=1 Tax=Jatrophihabitans sp. GAS493 TaxID=1907575 RepID=UPI000BB7809F|nr:YoaK family protein [Jatrophihabitans sp. GAS493]SOD74568.1 uncharacterized membrane protein YoaK (UPF0700 family) [Jatrophihabitans sp. GAS493]